MRYQTEHDDKNTAREGVKKSAGRYGETEMMRKSAQHTQLKWRDVAKEQCATGDKINNQEEMQFCLHCIEILGKHNIFDYKDWTKRKVRLEQENPALYNRIETCVDELVSYGVFKKK